MKKSTLMILFITLCLTACSPQIASSFYNPATRPTATQSAPIHDIPKIVDVLNQLAQQNMSMVQKQGWWHRTNTIIEQSGDLHSPNYESWYYLPQDPSKCLIRMDISKNPDSGEIMLWQIQTEAGYLGDLISLRRGDSEVIKVDPSVCRLTEATTEAGYLALSLQGDASGKDSRHTPEWAKAWYEEQDGKSVFVVHAGFKTSFENLTTQTEIYYFDVQSGMALKHYLGMGYEFDTEMGRFITKSYYELWEEMPKDVAAQYEQASQELKSFAEGALNTSDPSSSSEPTTQTIDLQSLMAPYTKENPLTDEAQLVAAVRELARRQVTWMSQPGWLLQEQIFGEGKDFTRQQYTLVHIIGDNGECREQMVYFYKDGSISPWIVRLENGTSGNMYSLDRAENLQGQIKENTACSLSNGESIFVEGDFLLVDEADELRSFISKNQNGLINGFVKAWVEERDDRQVFVLAYHIEKDAANGGLVMNPTTQELEPYTQSDKLNYYDMEIGTPVWEVESFTFQSGFVSGFGEGLRYSWDKYTNLPNEIKQAYDRAAETLKFTLENNS